MGQLQNDLLHIIAYCSTDTNRETLGTVARKLGLMKYFLWMHHENMHSSTEIFSKR